MDTFRESIKSVLDPIFENQYSQALFILFISIYAGYTAPILPDAVAHLFQRSVFRIVILFLINFATTGKVVPSLVVALLAFFVFPMIENSNLLYWAESTGANLITDLTGEPINLTQYQKSSDDNNN